MDVHNVEKDEDQYDENRDSDTDVDDDDEHLDKDTGVINNVVKEVCMEDSQDIKKDIQSLSGFISDGVKTNLCNLQNALSKISTTSNKCATQTYTPLLELSNGTFIRKTTAVWLFQEGERVSSDRLFRVRAKQPFTLIAQQPVLTHPRVLDRYAIEYPMSSMDSPEYITCILVLKHTVHKYQGV